MHVHGPGQRRIARRAELHGRHVDDVRQPRQVLDGACDRAGRRRSSRRLRPPEPRARRDRRSARPRPPLARRRALGHSGERRPHLAGDAEDQDVARRLWRDRQTSSGVGSLRRSSSASTEAKRLGRIEALMPSSRGTQVECGPSGLPASVAWRRNPSRHRPRSRDRRANRVRAVHL